MNLIRSYNFLRVFCLGLLIGFCLLLVASVDFNLKQISFIFIFALVIWGWLFTKVPLFVTGILGVCSCIFFSVIEPNIALSNFAHPIIFIFLGGYLFAQALSNRKLDQRIAAKVLNHPLVHGSVLRIILAIYFLTAFFSMWISNTATTTLMLPVILSILKHLKNINPKLESIILIGLAYSANIGGIATPIGSTPNILTIGLLKELAGVEVSFFKWMILSTPLLFIFLFILVYMMKKFTSFEKLDYSFDSIDLNLAPERSMNRGDRVLILLFILMILFWFLPSFIPSLKNILHPGIVALFFSMLLFIFPLKTEVFDAQDSGAGAQEKRNLIDESDGKLLGARQLRKIAWSSLLLFGSGLTLGKIFFDSGLASMAGSFLIENLLGRALFVTLLVMVFISIFSTELSSNTATANILLPLAISMTINLGQSALPLAMAVAISCSMAFMLPVATPPNVIVYSSGKVHLKDMLMLGFVLNLIFGFILVCYLFLLSFIL